eukprot:TRINITY_DN57_c0_g2_i3.p1 TRINITY_DN57_c0_g2~~TRINITY_DN57_c0_g2_i3.p1  ORF type:complete len:197 (-),score=43.73 TRINITY_DN57_c0_g2_i3:175-765(-)
MVDVEGENRIDQQLCSSHKSMYYEWSAVDDCGNTNSCDRSYEVVDTTPPVVAHGEMFCFPLTTYGPNLGQYAVYEDISLQLVDNCEDENDLTVTMLRCNSTQYTNDNGNFDENNCKYFAASRKLFVKMYANPNNHRGRFYYVWFRIADPCGNDDIVKRTIWVPANAYAYQDAIGRGDCPYGIGTEEFVARVPVMAS